MKKTIVTILSIVFPILIIIQLLSYFQTSKHNPWIIKPGQRPLVIAHGGSKLLFPENTMIAFDGSLEIGVDVLEMDVNITKDGILVLHHDERIDRTSDGKGKVSKFNYEELLNYNFGYRFKDLKGDYPYRHEHVHIPKVEDVLIKYNNYPMIIEIKNKGKLGLKAAEELKKLILKHGLEDRVIIASFHDEVLKHFKKITHHSIKTSSSTKEAVKFVMLSLIFLDPFYKSDDVAIQLPFKHGISLNTKRIINAAHRKNMAVHYWTVNDKNTMKDLINKGADGIITDRPDILNELLMEMEFPSN